MKKKNETADFIISKLMEDLDRLSSDYESLRELTSNYLYEVNSPMQEFLFHQSKDMLYLARQFGRAINN